MAYISGWLDDPAEIVQVGLVALWAEPNTPVKRVGKLKTALW